MRGPCGQPFLCGIGHHVDRTPYFGTAESLPDMRKLLPALAFLLFMVPQAHAQIVTSNAMSAQQLVQDLLVGGGVQIFNVTYNGQANVPGGQNAIGSFTSSNTILPLEAGIALSTGSVTQIPIIGIGSPGSAAGSDPDLVLLSGGQTINDKSILEFDFIPTGDTVSFRYIFASVEYNNYTCSNFNDAFGFFISGPGINGPFSNNSMNIAVVPGTQIPITINTINSGTPSNANNIHHCFNADPNWQSNSQYFISNNPAQDMRFNGLTVVLTAKAPVICGQVHHIKLAIGDAQDSGFDSGVFLEAGSFTSAGQVIPELAGGVGVEGTAMMEGCGPFELVFTRLGDLAEEATVTLTAGGTATPGVDYFPPIPSELYFPPDVEHISLWVDVPLDDDGPETIVIDILQLIVCAGQELLTTFTFHIDSPPPLEVQSYDINGICGETHTLDPAVEGGVGMYEYAWSTGVDTSLIEVSPGVTTVYELTVSDGCAVEPVTVEYVVTLPVYLPLEVEMGPDLVIHCLETEPATVSAVTGGDNNYTYVWTLHGAQLGTGPSLVVGASDPPNWYVVTITDGCGSVIQDSLVVSTLELPPVVVATAPYQTVICAGDPTTLQVTGVTGGTGVYTYEWVSQDGETVSSYSSVEVIVDSDHAYAVIATDQCGATGESIVVTLLPVYAPFILDLPADQWICAGDEIELFARVTGGSGYYTLEWEDLQHSDPWLTVDPLEDTRYTVTALDQCGELVMDRTTVRVEHVEVRIVETNRGQDDWYMQAATTPLAQTYIWDMGDGTILRGPEIDHSYYDLEDHWVTLRIVTPNGCVGIDSVQLRAPAHFYFPNAFTPDGDGHNDFFGPVGEYIKEFEMWVFDRWGREVFASNTLNRTWDGTINGSDRAPTGVYVFKYRVAGHYFPAVEGLGQVTLMQGSIEY
jgi:gliding motility-associated-like protein